MTPEEKQELNEHVQAIAKILRKESSSHPMTTLGEIESVVREQLQTHVSPQLGLFLSKTLPEPLADTNEK